MRPEQAIANHAHERMLFFIVHDYLLRISQAALDVIFGVSYNLNTIRSKKIECCEQGELIR
jgi:hypothetical protein